MIRLPFLCLLLVLSCRQVLALESFCALTLQIETPDGQPARRTWVELRDPTGKMVLQEQVHGPVLTICDFGPGPHSLTTGGNQCHPTTISNLYMKMGHPISLRVRQQKCEIYSSEHSGCEFLARIRDERGRAISGARLLLNGFEGPERSDEFGRLVIWLVSAHNDVVADAPGYRPQSIAVQCESGDNLDREIHLQTNVK